MDQPGPIFPVTVFRRKRSWLPWKEAVVEEDTLEEVLDLETDWEWFDSRGNPDVWLVDANLKIWDFKLNYLMGEPTEFYVRRQPL